MSRLQRKDTGIEDQTVLYLPDDGKTELKKTDIITDLVLVSLSEDKKIGCLEIDHECDYMWKTDREVDLDSGRARVRRTT
jgi:hypothetical protein